MHVCSDAVVRDVVRVRRGTVGRGSLCFGAALQMGILRRRSPLLRSQSHLLLNTCRGVTEYHKISLKTYLLLKGGDRTVLTLPLLR